MINQSNHEMTYLNVVCGRFRGPSHLDKDKINLSIKEIFRYMYGQLPHVIVVEVK